MRYHSNFETNVNLSTDRAKRVVFKIIYDGRHYLNQQTGYNQVHPSMIFRIGNHIRLTGQLDYAWNKDNLQYVSTVVPTGNSDAKTEYIMGRMRQETYGVTVNMQVNLTPDISIQYYGSPFTSVAKYDQFKRAADTRSHTYANRFHEFASNEISYNDGRYITSNQQLSFKDPNFSFNELRSNLVARWEYLPGSTLYLVWEHRRSNQNDVYQPGWGSNIDNMFGLPATNTVMVKINYWFSL